MADREKVIKAVDICIGHGHCEDCSYCLTRAGYTTMDCRKLMLTDVLALLKDQEELLRKLQKDKDKLCLEVSEWKHKFHDAPPKFVSQGVVDQIRWERDTALSQLEQIGKGLGSKMDDIVAMLKAQKAVKPHKGTHPEESAFDCGVCGYPLWEDENYCAHCGKPILWEGR